MASFDVEQQRVCVRVVYDGVASAGKTTNLRLLAELFATQRTCEVFSPAETGGRTLYFDWLQIAAGMVCGFPLVCQVITVPGQVVLTPRRRHLLSTADVVVYVCDSDEGAVARAVDGLAPFARLCEEAGAEVPLVVQANKQDQPSALSGAALLARLGRTDAPVVEAIASDGVGVVDTFVSAVRAAVRSIQARVELGAVRVDVRPAETADEALSKLSAVEVDPEWAAEMLLEEAAHALGAELAADPAPFAAEEDEPPATWRPEIVGRAPVAPTEHVPTGCIWPAHTGRASLRALAVEPAMKEPHSLDGDGTTRRAIGEFVLSTARALCFDSHEAARQALVRAARARTQLGALLEPETVLVAQPAPDGTSWLWTIEPRMPTVAQLAAGVGLREPVRPTFLPAFGAALADALKVEMTHGVRLELLPGSFGVRQGVVRYIGAIELAEASSRDAGRSIEAALAPLTAHVDDLEPVVAALESALAANLSAEDRSRLAQSATWSEAASLPPALRETRRRIEGAWSRGTRAA